MATFRELQTKVSARLKDPNNVDVSASDVATVINDAIEHWSKRRFWFNEFEENVTLTVGDPALTLVMNTPLYLFKEDGVVIDYSNMRWPLTKVSPAEYDRMNVEGNGLPFAWTERNDAYEVYWYPDIAYTAVVRGIVYVAPFELEGQQNDSNIFTINAPDLIMYEALSRLYGEFRQDPKMEDYYANRAMNEEKALKRQTRRDKATGRIQVGGF